MESTYKHAGCETHGLARYPPLVPVGLECVIKLPSEAGRARGNAFASGNIPIGVPGCGFTTDLRRHVTLKRSVNVLVAGITWEGVKLSLQSSVPERGVHGSLVIIRWPF